MPNYVGSNLRRSGQEMVFDPQRGNTLVETWTGTPEALLSLALALKNANVQCRWSQSEGRSTLFAYYGNLNDGNEAEVPVDHFEIYTDFVQESIWRSPLVWNAAGGDAELIAEWRDEVEAQMKASDDGGPVKPSATGFTGTQLSIYKHYLAGETSFETERVVLMRVRTFSITYAQQVNLQPEPRIYSTSALTSTFSIPSALASRLPATPTYAPSGMSWGWMKRQDRSTYTWGGKVEEVREWVFSPWSTLLYDHIT